MSVARKLFRLFKSFNEYQTIKKTLAGSAEAVDKYITIATRLAFLFYWLFDNIGVLIKIKFIKSWDFQNALRRANKAWFTGLVLMLIGGIRQLVLLATETKKVKAEKARGAIDESTYSDKQKQIAAKRLTAIFTIVKALGDSTTASQGLGYPKQYLGFEFNDGVVGLGGFTSAFLTCYQNFPK